MQAPYSNNEYYLRRFRELANELADTVERKNKDYGNSVGYHGVLGIMPRIADKFFRLDNIIWNGMFFEPNYESVMDTALDLAAYALIMAVGLEYKHRAMKGDAGAC